VAESKETSDQQTDNSDEPTDEDEEDEEEDEDETAASLVHSVEPATGKLLFY